MPAPSVGRRISRFSWGLLLVSLAASLGCYKYVPTTMDAVPVGANVRAVLSSEAREDMRTRLGVDAAMIDGKLLDQNADQVLLSVPTVRVANPFGAETLRQRIDVPRQGIANVELRQLDVFRTFGLAGAIAGATAIVTAMALDESEPGSPNDGTTPPNDHVMKRLFSLTLWRW